MEKPVISEWPEGWLQVRIPLPYSLKWVNAYLLPGPEGWTLIDPGLRTPETEEIWTGTLERAGIRSQDIAQIVLTHHHPDHYGLAGWVQEHTGAPVRMSRKARETAVRMWGEGETFSEEMLAAFRAHGLPQELEASMREHLYGFRERISPQPTEIETIREGNHVRMGGTDWLVIGGEGHAPGHLSFYDRTSRRILCGDQVIPDISPNIGWLPGGDSSPLASYLASLSGMLELDVALAFPGHREPFARFRERTSELLAHHERRLEKIVGLLGPMPESSFDICEKLFGGHLRSNLHNLRFALAETIAHLLLLAERGLIRVSDDGEGKWSAAGAGTGKHMTV